MADSSAANAGGEGIEGRVRSEPGVEPMTPYLGIDVENETWVCRKCSRVLGDASENVKKGLLVRERDPSEVHRPLISDEYKYTYQPDAAWCRILEYFCPDCATMVEVEYLPPGHPPTNEIEPDLDALRRRHEREESSGA